VTPAESAAQHRAIAIEKLMTVRLSGGPSNIADVLASAQVHATLAILDTLTASVAPVCLCPKALAFHATNCKAYRAPLGGDSTPVSPAAPTGGTRGWTDPETDRKASA
jgi:hypothetical protein